MADMKVFKIRDLLKDLSSDKALGYYLGNDNITVLPKEVMCFTVSGLKAKEVTLQLNDNILNIFRVEDNKVKEKLASVVIK